MALPTFLGIGAQRSGTTWLHAQLAAHPEVFVPRQRKELHFFDWNYQRGRQWYEKWFPVDPLECTCIGEFTPEYLFDETVPERIAATLEAPRFIAILRHPVDRAYSHYLYRVQRMADRRSFDAFYEEQEDARSRGMYARQLDRFLRFFPKDRFLLLVFERLMANPEVGLAQVAAFLGIDPDGFDASRIREKLHSATHRFRFAGPFDLLRRASKRLEQAELDGLRNLAKGPALRLFRSRRAMPALAPERRTRLFEDYREDVERLREIWEVDVSLWEPADPNTSMAGGTRA